MLESPLSPRSGCAPPFLQTPVPWSFAAVLPGLPCLRWESHGAEQGDGRAGFLAPGLTSSRRVWVMAFWDGSLFLCLFFRKLC